MRQSQLFTKTSKENPSGEVSLNAQLLIKAGFVDKEMAGVYSYLPLGLRVLDKIKNIVRDEMDKLGGQEILMPALHPKDNYEKTGRWNEIDVLFKLDGAGGKEYALGATHEEIVTPLVKKFANSYKDLPVFVYQIQDKFRNEPRAKSGLLRGREFSMKDLYSFHKTKEGLDEFYEKSKQAYFNVYKRCGLGDLTHIVFASGGIFSKYSHEFQTVTEYGEDIIYVCEKCGVGINKEIIDEQKVCPECGGEKLNEKKAIEVGNIFKLKTKFTDAFDYKFTDEKGQKQPVLMGCYGIGPSRVLGTVVEVSHDEKGMIWPESIAPFQVHLISLGDDGKVEAEKIYNEMIEKGIEVLWDDRDVQAGVKFADSDLIGIPKRIVVSKKTLENKSVEVKMRNSDDVEMIEIDKL